MEEHKPVSGEDAKNQGQAPRETMELEMKMELEQKKQELRDQLKLGSGQRPVALKDENCNRPLIFWTVPLAHQRSFSFHKRFCTRDSVPSRSGDELHPPSSSIFSIPPQSHEADDDRWIVSTNVANR